jgi:hypothetical protein
LFNFRCRYKNSIYFLFAVFKIQLGSTLVINFIWPTQLSKTKLRNLSGKNDRQATVFKNSSKNEIIVQDEGIGVKVLINICTIIWAYSDKHLRSCYSFTLCPKHEQKMQPRFVSTFQENLITLKNHISSSREARIMKQGSN